MFNVLIFWGIDWWHGCNCVYRYSPVIRIFLEIWLKSKSDKMIRWKGGDVKQWNKSQHERLDANKSQDTCVFSSYLLLPVLPTYFVWHFSSLGLIDRPSVPHGQILRWRVPHIWARSNASFRRGWRHKGGPHGSNIP